MTFTTRRLAASMLSLLLLVSSFSGAAFAACGLHALRETADPEKSALELSAGYHRVAFDLAGVTGAYSEFDPEIRYAVLPGVTLGLQWPLLMLETPDMTHLGSGNPILFSEYRHALGQVQSLSLGLQMEAPFGDADKGLATDRFMGVAYAGLSRIFGRWFGGGTLGSSVMLPFMDPHRNMEMTGMAGMPDMDMPNMHGMESGSGMSPVHPHENWELLYRLSAGVALWNGKVFPTLAAIGQHVLGQTMMADAGRDFLTSSLSLPVSLGRTVLEPDLMIPVSSDHRFEWNLGLTVRRSL
jgi:hypothetical protein